MLMHLQPSLQCHANSCHHLCCVTPDDMEEYSSPAAPWSPPDDDLLPPLVAMDSSAGATLHTAHASSAASCHRSCNPCDVPPATWLTPALSTYSDVASLLLRHVAAVSDVPSSLMSPVNLSYISPLADEMSLDLRFLATPSSPTGAMKLPWRTYIRIPLRSSPRNDLPVVIIPIISIKLPIVCVIIKSKYWINYFKTLFLNYIT